MQELLNETLGRAVCVEAAGIATEKEITLEEALQEIREGIGLSRAENLAIGTGNRPRTERKADDSTKQTSQQR